VKSSCGISGDNQSTGLSISSSYTTRPPHWCYSIPREVKRITRLWKIGTGRLELQARGRKIRKLLVRSKLDLPGVVDQRRVGQLKEQCGISDYYEVSALSGEGLERLRQDVNAALAWDEMAKISRPANYQSIRDAIQEERKRTAVVFYAELEKRLGAKDLDTVLSQLALEGQIVEVRLAQGDRVLVLRIDVVSDTPAR